MKKRFWILAAALLLCGLFAVGVSAADGTTYTEGYYTYTVSLSNVTITSVDRAISGDVVVPAKLGGFPVTEISYHAFHQCTALTGVVLPDTVSSIGSYAFANCTNLKSIHLPASLTLINTRMLDNCRSLESVVIPEGVTVIGQHAFAGCSALTSVSLPDTLTSIQSDAFGYCSSLTSISIPNSVTVIEGAAFSCCSALTDVNIPEGITSIGAYMFHYCVSLEEIRLPDSVTFIGSRAFEGCSNLKSINIPAGVSVIQDRAFSGCSALVSPIDIPYGVTVLTECVFQGCSGLTSIRIPDSVTSIQLNAFSGCSGLTEIAIPDTVTDISLGVFAGCSGLTSIYIPDGATTSLHSTFQGCSSLTSIRIPDSVTKIGGDVFENCTSLTEITLPAGITEIGPYAFQGCTALTGIVIPAAVTTMGQYAFSGCSALESINIPDGITTIGEKTFYGCTSLTNIVVPDSVTFINSGAFQSCTNLKSVTLPAGLNTMSGSAFTGCPNLTIHGYAGSYAETFANNQSIPFAPIAVTVASGTFGEGLSWVLDDAGTLTISGTGKMESESSGSGIPWSSYMDKISSVVIEDGVRSVAANAFRGAVNLISVSIPDGVQSIGDDAFYGCSALESVSLPESILELGPSAFWRCTKLKTINIPQNVDVINNSLFQSCYALTSIQIPDGVTTIGMSAFEGTALKQVILPDSVTTISIGAFRSCSSLEEIYLPNSVTRIMYYAFSGCSKLKSVTIPTGLTTLDTCIFEGCSSLTEIVLPANVASLGEGAFADCSQLAKITFQGKIYSFGRGAFSGCSSLTEFTIPDNFTSVSEELFENCTSLTKVVIPESVWIIESNAFYNCPNLTIYGYTGSKAQEYADSNGIPFAALDGSGSTSGSFGESLGWSLANGVLTVSGTGSMAEGDVPWNDHRAEITSVVIGDGVTSISDRAFENCISLSSVTIPDSVISIGNFAFSGCKSMTGITIPASVQAIGSGAFQDCMKLESIVLPDGITVIENSTFYQCDNLASVTIPDSVTTIGDYAFQSCHKLRALPVMNGVTSIGAYAFCLCDGMMEAVLPDGIVSVGQEAFQGCTSLQRAVIPEGITTIGARLFSGCTLLTEVVLPSTCTGTFSAFAGCSSLKSATIPAGITTLGDSAFNGCKSLTEIVIPDSVKTIERWAFQGCTGLTKIVIPDSVTSIGIESFQKCTSLKEITLSKSLTSLPHRLFYQCGKLESVTLAAGVSYIGNEVFYECSALQYVSAPGLTSIGQHAFQNCSSLQTVALPDKINGIGYAAFSGCSSLNMNIPSGIGSVEASTFANCDSLTTVAIPAGVTSIKTSAFDGCDALTEVAIPNSVQNISDYAFSDCPVLKKVFIPASVTSLGLAAFQNSPNVVLFGYAGSEAETFANKYSIPFTVIEDISGTCGENITWTLSEGKLTITGTGAMTNYYGSEAPWYEYREDITSVVIGEGVTSIGRCPFVDCTALVTVSIPSTVTSLEYSAFNQYNSLAEILVSKDNPEYFSMDGVLFSVKTKALLRYPPAKTAESYRIPDGTLVLGECAFMDNPFLQQVTFPEGLLTVGESAFMNCTAITEIALPDSVVSIGNYAFYSCEKIEAVTLPANLTEIGKNAFTACSALKEAVLPNGLTALPYGVFHTCDSLTKLVIPRSVVTFDESAIVNCDALRIYGYDGSAAQTYAKAKSIPFMVIEEDPSGSCGEKLTWTLKDSTLTITGTGAMTDYSSAASAPWYGYRQNITAVVIGEGVTSIGSHAFDGYTALTSVSVPDTVVSVGEKAFPGSQTVVLVTATNYTIYGNESKVYEKEYIRYQALDVQGEPAGTQYHVHGSRFGLPDAAAINESAGRAFCLYSLDGSGDFFFALPLTQMYENRGTDSMTVRYSRPEGVGTLTIGETGYRLVNAYTPLNEQLSWNKDAAGTDQIKLYESFGRPILGEDGTVTGACGGFNLLSGTHGKLAYADFAVSDASMDGNPDRATMRVYGFGQITFSKRKDNSNKDQETFNIRWSQEQPLSSAGFTGGVRTDYRSSKSTGLPFVSEFRWTGMSRKEIPSGAYVLFYIDEYNREVDILQVIDTDASDGTYTLKGYLRGIDATNDQILMGTEQTAYSIGYNGLLYSPLKTHTSASANANLTQNAQILSSMNGKYVSLVIVDNRVVMVTPAAPLNEYVIIDSLAAVEEDGVVANVWNTVTDSCSQVKISELNGWPLDNYIPEEGPLREKEVYQIVYIQKDGGYSLTNPSSAPTAELRINAYGYIEGTKGTGAQYGSQYYTTASEQDYWLILVQETGTVFSVNGLVEPVVDISGRIFKSAANDYVIAVDSLSQISGWENLTNSAENVQFMLYSDALTAGNDGFLQNGINPYAYTVLMQNILTGDVQTVSLDPSLVPASWGGAIGLENGALYRPEDGVLHDLRTYSFADAAEYYGKTPAYKRSGSLQVWSGSGCYDIRKAIAYEWIEEMFAGQTVTEELLTSCMEKVTVYARTADTSRMLKADENTVNTVLAEQGRIFNVYYVIDPDGTATAWVGDSIRQEEKTTQFVQFSEVTAGVETSYENGFFYCNIIMTDVLTNAKIWVRVDPSLIPASWDGAGFPPVGLENGRIYRTSNAVLSDTAGYTFGDVAEFYKSCAAYEGGTLQLNGGTNQNSIRRTAAQEVISVLFPEWGNPSGLITAYANRVRTYILAEDESGAMTNSANVINSIVGDTTRSFTVYYVFTEDGDTTAWITDNRTQYSGRIEGDVTTCGDETEETVILLMQDGVLLKELRLTGSTVEFSFTGLPEGVYDLILSKKGHVSQTATLEVSETFPLPYLIVQLLLSGDVNGDIVINGKDLTLIRRCISGGFTLNNFSEAAADVNLDGVINGKDLTLIRRYISGGFDVTLGN